MHTFKVSIITAFYNAELYISETIKSILNQSYTNWEHILVDDGSNDNSQYIINEYAIKDDRIQLFKRINMPKGASNCRNIGLEKAQGEYIIYLDADDILDPNCLYNRVKYISQHPYCELSIFKMEYFNHTPGDTKRVLNTYDRNKDYLKLFLKGFNPWQTTCSFWKKDFLLKIGGWDIELQRITDPNIHTRALLHPDINLLVNEQSQTDCYYRLNSNVQQRNEQWLINSIQGRIKFFMKCYASISSQKMIKASQKETYYSYISEGIISFIKDWLFSRLKTTQTDYNQLINWCNEKKIISKKKMMIIHSLAFLWINDNTVIKKTRIKGILSKLL
jgi:glycosyltransferase involved in cell wall biosynthesis